MRLNVMLLLVISAALAVSIEYPSLRLSHPDPGGGMTAQQILGPSRDGANGLIAFSKRLSKTPGAFNPFAPSLIDNPFSAPTQACGGQKGKVLYSENLVDFGITHEGIVVLASGTKYSVIPPGHFFNQADYCLDMVFPPNDPAVISFTAGVRFLSSADSTEFYLADLTNSGVVSLYHGRSPAHVTKLWSVDQKATANLTAGASNAIETVVKGSTISVLLNGRLVKTIRAQIPNGGLSFGFDLEVKRAAPPGAFMIRSIKVTEAL